MPAPTAPTEADIAHAAQAAWPGLTLQWLPQIDSTNTELMRRASQGQAQPLLLVADTQTAGRGRMGRSWQAHPGRALTFSLGLPLAPQDWRGLSLAVGVALVASLHTWARAQGATPAAHARLGLKWPNDLWLLQEGGRIGKVAGILIETAGMPGPDTPQRYAVIGIGINLLPSPQEAAAAPPMAGVTAVPPASVAEWAGIPAQAPSLLHTLAPALLTTVAQFEAEGFAASQHSFATWDVLAGQPVVLSDGRQGHSLGVDAYGHLLLSQENGVVLPVASGEVSVRPARPQARAS